MRPRGGRQVTLEVEAGRVRDSIMPVPPRRHGLIKCQLKLRLLALDIVNGAGTAPQGA